MYSATAVGTNLVISNPNEEYTLILVEERVFPAVLSWIKSLLKVVKKYYFNPEISFEKSSLEKDASVQADKMRSGYFQVLKS